MKAHDLKLHFEKLRNRVDGNGAVPFEARIETADCHGSIRWLAADLMPPRLKQAAVLFSDGHTVRQVAALLGITVAKRDGFGYAPLTPGCL
jgi:hypothetical protein